MNRYTYSNPIDNVMNLTLSTTAITDYYLKNVKSLILKTESDNDGKPDEGSVPFHRQISVN